MALARGEVVKFNAEGAQYHEKYKNKQRVIVGKTKESNTVVVGLSQVLRACIAKDRVVTEDGEQAFSVLLLVTVAGLLIAAFVNGSLSQ